MPAPMPFDYVRPSALNEALAAAARGARVMAGCTDLFPATQRQTLADPAGLVDVTGVADLRGIRRDGLDGRERRGWRIGAATTWAAIRDAGEREDAITDGGLPPAFDGLRRAAAEVGGAQIQNAGTIGGNLCTASPAADGVPPLLTLDAAVELSSEAGVRSLPLAAFLTGPRRTALAAGEIVTAILVPEAAGAGRAAFLKLGARKHLVISIAMVAVRIVERGGVIGEAALAVGACGPVATRLPEIEAALVGAPLADAKVDPAAVARALAPIDDIRADAAYRAEAAATLLRRALEGLAR